MSETTFDGLLEDIKNSIYPFRQPLSRWKFKDGDFHDAHKPTLNDSKWHEAELPFTWGGYDNISWFRNTIALTPEFIGKSVVLLLDHPESLVYVNGMPFQGIDKHHNELLLTSSGRKGESFSIAIQAYSGRKPEQNIFSKAYLAALHPPARKLYHFLYFLKKLQNEVETPHAKEIKDFIGKILVYVKYFRPDSQEFQNSEIRALNFIEETLQTEYKTSLKGLMHLIGHSHIDVVWLWTLQETARKCGRTFSSMLRLMEEFPWFKFSQSQAYLYELTKKHYPDIYKSIKERVTEGRWEPIGSMWVEPDCNIPDGESIIRQILIGRKFFRNEFNTESNVLWLPDTFGYPWALPQILKKSGFEHFFTTKLNWNDTNTFPHNSFLWEGIDGTRILAHNPPVGLEGQIKPEYLIKSVNDFKESDHSSTMMMTFGYGDGGGGVSKDQLDLAPYIRSLVGLIPTTLSTMKDFLGDYQKDQGKLPVYQNELYLELHRGTLTTHAWLKKNNREAERNLFFAELLSVYDILYGPNSAKGSTSQQAIDEAWKLTLLNQFHDILPGTAIKEAYADTADHYNKIFSLTTGSIAHVNKNLTEKKKTSQKEFSTTYFNPLTWARNEYLEISVPFVFKHFEVKDSRGKLIEYQVIARSVKSTQLLVFIPDIPPLSALTISVIETDVPQSIKAGWKVSTHIIETPVFKIRLDKKGQFISVYHRAQKRELVRKGGRLNEFILFRDTPKQWEAWEVEADMERHKVHILEHNSTLITEAGPIRTTIQNSWKTPQGTTILQNIRLYHRSDRIDFDTELEWNEKQVLLKAAFPLSVSSRYAWFETQFGAIKRPTRPQNPIDKAKFEVPVQQWMDISDSKGGVSILNDCKYGADVKDSTLRLTLLRSPYYPHPIEPHKLRDIENTDQGKHSFRYSLYCHLKDWRIGETVYRAKEFNIPLIHLNGPLKKAVRPLLALEGKGVFISAIKRSENGEYIVVRLYEAHGSTVSCSVDTGLPIKESLESDLMENPSGNVKRNKNGMQLKFKPFEIKTLLLKFAKKPGR